MSECELQGPSQKGSALHTVPSSPGVPSLRLPQRCVRHAPRAPARRPLPAAVTAGRPVLRMGAGPARGSRCRERRRDRGSARLRLPAARSRTAGSRGRCAEPQLRLPRCPQAPDSQHRRPRPGAPVGLPTASTVRLQSRILFVLPSSSVTFNTSYITDHQNFHFRETPTPTFWVIF